MRKTDFVQSLINIDGKPLRFTDRPYIYTIYNSPGKEKLLMAGRQAEKSTTLACNMVCESSIPHNSSLYVTPTMQQTGVFSRGKIDEIYLTSPKLRRLFYRKGKNISMSEKRLLNFSTMYFRSAYYTADSIRGITARRIYVDEIQDIISDVIPVIDECAGHQPDALFIRAGTPKTNDNLIQKKWDISTQCEWMVKCKKCNHWNTLTTVDILHPGEPGLFCTRCGTRMYTKYGVWVSGYPDAYIKGYRLPQIILPERYIDWERLFQKIKDYSTSKLMNEVFGVSWDSGAKPITRAELIACCQEYRNTPEYKPQYLRYPVFVGIDWGTGEKSFSVMSAGIFINDIYRVIFLKRYIGNEAGKERMLADMIKLITQLKSEYIGVDWGFGWGVNQDIRKMVGGRGTVIEFFSSGNLKDFARWDGRKIILNRTEAMTDIFLRIQRKQIQLPRWEDFEDFAEDFLVIFAEYNEKTRRMQYDHPQDKPDDAFHAVMYGYLIGLHYHNKLPLTQE